MSGNKGLGGIFSDEWFSMRCPLSILPQGHPIQGDVCGAAGYPDVWESLELLKSLKEELTQLNKDGIKGHIK